MPAEHLCSAGLVLGESPIRLEGADRFACVDIRRGYVLTGDLTGALQVAHRFDSTVGAVAECSDGDLLVALAGRLAVASNPELHIELGSASPLVRMNDGKPDPLGRFVGGTMAEPVQHGAGSLWSFSGGSAHRLVESVTISNGLCWSASKDTMFYVDTPTQRIDAFDYDIETGGVSERRTVAEIPADVGSPDGMTIDCEGGLWVAIWGGGAVHRYLDGNLDEVVEIPTPLVTCPTFVGADLDTLLITTATNEEVDTAGAGDLYTARVGVPGLPANRADKSMLFGGTS